MDSQNLKAVSFPVGLVTAFVITSGLFLVLPQLPQLRWHLPGDNRTVEVLIRNYKPAPPPSATRDQEAPPRLIEKTPPAQSKPSQNVKTDIDIPKITLSTGLDGLVSLPIVPFSGMDGKAAPRRIMTLQEVDQPPKLVKSVRPPYPFQATRDNISGWVLLRFIVDAEGKVSEPEAVEASPEGVFEESALKAVLRYRFTPAVNDGQNVACIVKQKMVFQLD